MSDGQKQRSRMNAALRWETACRSGINMLITISSVMSLHECTLRLTPVYLERTNFRGFSVPVAAETSISRSIPFTISLDVQRASGGPGFESCAIVATDRRTDAEWFPRVRDCLRYNSRSSSVVCVSVCVCVWWCGNVEETCTRGRYEGAALFSLWYRPR